MSRIAGMCYLFEGVNFALRPHPISYGSPTEGLEFALRPHRNWPLTSGQYVCCFHRSSDHYITATRRHRKVSNRKEHKPRERAFILFLWETLQRRRLAGNIIQTKTRHGQLQQRLLHQCNFSKIQMRLENTMASCICTPISRSLGLDRPEFIHEMIR